MAKLTSTIVYGNLDVTGNLTINGELLSNIAGELLMKELMLSNKQGLLLQLI